MNKQQGFFYQKINPRLAISIIIILAVFVGVESYWLSKSMSPSDKDILPSEKQAKDARLLEKEAVIRALEQEDARKRKEAFEEALKNPDKMLDIQRWVTGRNSLYGFEYKYPRELGANGPLGDVYVRIKPGKLDPANIQYNSKKIENPLLIKIGDRDWYRYTGDPYLGTCSDSVFQTGLDDKHHLEFVINFCNPREKPIPGVPAMSEKIISKILPTFTFAFSEEELSNWKTYHDIQYGISFSYPPTYKVTVDSNDQIVISPSGEG